MKKFLSFIFVILLSVLAFTGCKQQEDAGCSHENLSRWKMNADNHWAICLDCGEEVASAGHTGYGACLTCGFSNPPGTQGLRYEKITGKDEYAVTGFSGDTGLASVVIASRYNGYPVTTISTSAFTNNDSLVSIFIPYSIHTIESYSFVGCNKLASVDFVCKEGWAVYQSTAATNGEALTFEEVSNKAKMAIVLRSANSTTGYGRKTLKRTDTI